MTISTGYRNVLYILPFQGAYYKILPQHFLAIRDIDAFRHCAEVVRRSCAAAIKMIDERSGFSFSHHRRDAALPICKAEFLYFALLMIERR